jgi:hypothetical protein
MVSESQAVVEACRRSVIDARQIIDRGRATTEHSRIILSRLTTPRR